MIRVETIEDLHPVIRDRIKAKVMRRLIAHIRDRPQIADESLRRIFGYDRAELEALYEGALASAAQAPVEDAAALHARAQSHMLTGLAPAANDARSAPQPASEERTARPAGSCCGARARD
ncbi:hypothetical protein [Salinarimonas sp.]|uniref:hypothetical protein n=1 Tax=Salinarimonas sp. TaxID=2766526 RepID=UPI00391A14EF